MPIKLRPYQVEAVDAIWNEFDSNILNTLAVLPTGMGKTEAGMGAVERLLKRNPSARVLWLAHREELVVDPVLRIRKNWLGRLPVPGVVMASKNEFSRQFITASVQTLMRRRPNGRLVPRFKRLRKILKHGQIDMLVTDEAHHATAKSYMQIARALRTVNPELLHLGMTATPKRTDKDGLGKVYQSLAYKISIKDAIFKYKALVPPVGIRVPLTEEDAKFSTVRTVAGDYLNSDIESILDVRNVNEIIVKKWLEHGENRPTIAFTAGVAQAKSLAETFQDFGIAAEHLTGTTGTSKRREIIADYKAGRIKVLTNCFVLTEGFDAPATGCIINARPTKSDLVYIQIMGRGLRLHPTKTDCIIIDFAPVAARDLVFSDNILGIPLEVKKKIDAMREERLLIGDNVFQGRLDVGIDAEPDAIVMEMFDLFNMSRLRWMYGNAEFKGKPDTELAVVSINKDDTLAIVMPQTKRVDLAEQMMEDGTWIECKNWRDSYEALKKHRLYLHQKNKVELLGVFDAWEDAAQAAEEYGYKHAEAVLAEKGKRWLKTAPSSAQLGFAKTLGIDPTGMTKGDVANKITYNLTVRTLVNRNLI